MTPKSLSELDASLDYLRQHGAARDSLCGQWTIPDGIALGVSPLEAARALRSHLIAKQIADVRNTGRGYFTR